MDLSSEAHDDGETLSAWLRPRAGQHEITEYAVAFRRLTGTATGGRTRVSRSPTPHDALETGLSLTFNPETALADLGRCWIWLAASMGHPGAAIVLSRELVSEMRREEERLPGPELLLLVDEWLKLANRPGGNIHPAGLTRGPSPADAADDRDTDAADDEPEEGVTVAPRIGDPLSASGKDMAKRYAGLIGRKLPFSGHLPDPSEIEQKLVAKYPWASSLARYVKGQFALLASSGSGIPRLPPLLLVGPRGCGKTAMLEDIALWCRLPSLTVLVGGTHDSAGLAAVPRGWGTSQVCAPLQAIFDHKTANPAIILDEIEKGVSDENNRNGSVSGALLSMLKPPASGYRDPCLLADVDLTWISWMASANSLVPLPAPLRDRFQIQLVPSPSEEHFEGILTGVIENEARRLRMQPEFLPYLGRDERAWLKTVFVRGQCSIRQLENATRLMMGDRASAEATMANRPN